MALEDPRSRRSSVGRLRVALAGVRIRSALAATGVVAVALVVSAAVLLLLLQQSLIGAAQSAAATRAQDVAAVVRDEGEAELASTLRNRALPGEPVQVLRADGTVLASSAPVPGERPLGDLRPGPGRSMSFPGGRLEVLNLDDHYVLAARGVRHAGTDYVVLAAVDIDARRETVATVGVYLLGGLPVLLLVVGGATFVFVSRSLRPVERIRRRVAEIGGRHLDARVPVPTSRDEIALLAETMNSMLDRLQAAQEAQRRFVADASHELRSPLSTLRVGLEVAGSSATPADWEELHASLSAECDRMTRLVEDLLLLARADESSIALRLQDVDLDDMIGAEARRLRAGTALRVEVHTEPVRVRGDAVKLAQVVRNLAENAALHAHRRVVLSLRAEPGGAVVEIADDGPGVPAADRERIFERFVRLDAGRARAHGGSGLGLAIVREIATGHHGTVVVSEAPGGGALFRLHLPWEEPGAK